MRKGKSVDLVENANTGTQLSEGRKPRKCSAEVDRKRNQSAGKYKPPERCGKVTSNE